MGRDGPVLSMHSSLNFSPTKKEQAFKPGPGSYTHDRNKVLGKDPSWSMGTSVRVDL